VIWSRSKDDRTILQPLVDVRQFVTGIDATTAAAALLRALEAIDAGTFSIVAPLPENSGGVAASAHMGRHLMIVPFLQRRALIKIVSLQTKSPGSGLPLGECRLHEAADDRFAMRQLTAAK
jgi:hypothetical protein